MMKIQFFSISTGRMMSHQGLRFLLQLPARFLTVMLLLVLTLVATHTYLQPGFPVTHDGENHLARFANYKVAIREGQFPPRFAPNLMNHYGYPVFNYNYPLANILSLPFSLIKVHYEVTFKVLMVLIVCFGLIGVYGWLRSLFFSRGAARLGMILFGLSPFLTQILNVRGNIGELSAFCLIPWILWSIESSGSRRFVDRSVPLKNFVMNFIWPVSLLTAFLLSHNVTVLFGLPMIVIYGLLRFGKRWQKWVRFVAWLGLSIGLSLWFWLPAVMEQNLVVVAQADLVKQFLTQFATFAELLFAPTQFGFSYPGSIDGLSFRLGLMELILVIGAIIVLFKGQFLRTLRSKKVDLIDQPNLIVLLSAVVSILIFVCNLSFSTPLWQLIPLAKFIQFPWRLHLFWVICSLPSHYSQINLLFLVELS